MIGFLDRYNVFAAGFDGEPNTKLLASQNWQNYLQTSTTGDAYTQLYGLMNSYCFSAALSLMGDHNTAWSIPSMAQYHKQVSLNQGKNQVLVIAAAKDS
jgi:hypothetical protein